MQIKSSRLTMEVSMEFGNQSILFSKASLDSLLISTHLIDIKILRLKDLVNEMELQNNQKNI